MPFQFKKRQGGRVQYQEISEEYALLLAGLDSQRQSVEEMLLDLVDCPGRALSLTLGEMRYVEGEE